MANDCITDNSKMRPLTERKVYCFVFLIVKLSEPIGSFDARGRGDYKTNCVGAFDDMLVGCYVQLR